MREHYFLGKALTHTARNVRSAGVFVDNEKGPAAFCGALFVNLGESPGVVRLVTGQSDRRSPVDVENTWVSPERGTTRSWLPFSGTSRPLTRTTRSLESSPTFAVP